ncbi:MAG: histidine phosphatase family protein [Chloroflexi bacterium]|nr:histidine phosphatase family protein [Chloroflexota bacterium]
MPELLLMRHCKSSWADQGLADSERPLTKRGKSDATAMGQLLVEREFIPDVILTSPAKRARSTAKRVARALDRPVKPRVVPSLYGAAPEEILSLLSGLEEAPKRVLVIGHNPSVEELVAQLTEVRVAIRTGAIARITLDAPDWASVRAGTTGKLHSVLPTPAYRGTL